MSDLEARLRRHVELLEESGGYDDLGAVPVTRGLLTRAADAIHAYEIASRELLRQVEEAEKENVRLHDVFQHDRAWLHMAEDIVDAANEVAPIVSADRDEFGSTDEFDKKLARLNACLEAWSEALDGAPAVLDCDETIARLTEAKDGAYRERDQLVAVNTELRTTIARDQIVIRRHLAPDSGLVSTPDSIRHDAASAIDTARALLVNGEIETGLAELGRAAKLLRGGS